MPPPLFVEIVLFETVTWLPMVNMPAPETHFKQTGLPVGPDGQMTVPLMTTAFLGMMTIPSRT